MAKSHHQQRNRHHLARGRSLCFESLSSRELMAADAFQFTAFAPEPAEIGVAASIATVQSTASTSSNPRAADARVITGTDLVASLDLSRNVSNITPSLRATNSDSEPNNTRSQANFIGQFSRGSHSRTFYGSTGSGTDTRDYFRFRVDGRTTGTITLSGMAQDLNFALHNSSGTQIASSRNSGTRTDSINLRDLAAGDYYIQVFPGVSGARSAYALRLGLNVASSTGGGGGGDTDRFDSEPNNTRSQADFIGPFSRGSHSRTFYGSTGSGTDTRDYFRFRVDGRTTGTITLSGMAQDMDFALYNSSGTQIASSRNSGTRTDSINLRDLAAGDYYIQVFPGVTGARSDYALRLGLNVR